MLLAMLLSGSVALPADVTSIEPICRNPGVITVRKGADQFSAKPLGDEPPAQHILAVLRTDFDGCVKPAVVNAKVGKR